MERSALALVLVATSTMFACNKKDDVSPPQAPGMITPMCIGSWAVDSTYLPSSDQYYPVIPKIYSFASNGIVTINSAGGTQSTWVFQVVEESAAPAPNEIGRTLIWATDTGSDPEVHLIILMLHQSATDGFLLITTALDHESPWNSLDQVTEDLVVNGNTVFPSWAKCYRQ